MTLIVLNEIVEESDHNGFNLNTTEFLLQKALLNRSCDHPIIHFEKL